VTIASTTSEEHDLAGARCAAYSLIALGFRYPDREWLSSLCEPTRWRTCPEHLADALDGASGHFPALRTVIDNLEQSGLEPLQEQFAALFGHSVRGACPPYELEFGRSEIIQRSADLADISGFYAAFGLELSGIINERADHISVEAEFLAVLCAKEALGIERENRDLVASVRHAQRLFLQSHLGRWLPAFSRRVLETSPGDFYAPLAEFARDFVAGECQRLGVSLGSPCLQLRPVDPIQEAAQSCGVPGECTAVSTTDEGVRTSPGEPCERGRVGEQFTQLNVALGSHGR